MKREKRRGSGEPEEKPQELMEKRGIDNDGYRYYYYRWFAAANPGMTSLPTSRRGRRPSPAGRSGP